MTNRKPTSCQKNPQRIQASCREAQTLINPLLVVNIKTKIWCACNETTIHMRQNGTYLTTIYRSPYGLQQ